MNTKTKMVMDIAEQIMESRLLIKNTQVVIENLETQLGSLLSEEKPTRTRKTTAKRKRMNRVQVSRGGGVYDKVVGAILGANGEITRKTILKVTGINKNSLQEVLQRAKDNGIIKFVRRGVYAGI